MIRRRRPNREIPFSFDSFLDIVANVVGVIIRLILVVWVGARSYTWLQHQARTLPQATRTGTVMALPADPLQQEIAQHRLELAQAKQRLLAQLRLLESCRRQETGLRQALAKLAAEREKLASKQALLDQRDLDRTGQTEFVALNSEELRRRSQKILAEIKDLEKTPPAKMVLRYRTPISHPVQSEELFFECQQGRVTFVDIATLLKEVRQRLPEKEQLLRSTWGTEDVTSILGSFRLRYSVERERGVLDLSLRSSAPGMERGFRYSLTSWQIEPVSPQRGETVETALHEGSEFRQIADGIEPQFTAVTFWVYPDSFALFRRLRDFLYERDIVVAGRPLPAGALIMSTPHGTVSRGQ
jgi:hypothetical protein